MGQREERPSLLCLPPSRLGNIPEQTSEYYGVLKTCMSIVKEGDNYFVYHWVFKEGVYGGKGTGAFSIMARMKRPTKEKVNYK